MQAAHCCYCPVLPVAQPGLGEVLVCLLGTLGATQQLMRSTASLAPRQLSAGPWRGDGDAAPYSGACMLGRKGWEHAAFLLGLV